MGRKGTSKPKGKKANPASAGGSSGSTSSHSAERPLVEDKGASPNRGGVKNKTKKGI